jgi:peptidylprolyl isomerase
MAEGITANSYPPRYAYRIMSSFGRTLRFLAKGATAATVGAACASVSAMCAPNSPVWITPYSTVETNSRVFFDIEITDGTSSWFGGGKSKPREAGRIEFELFDDTCPITTRNFRLLCKGDQGRSPDGKPLHFKGSSFHRIIPGFMLQGGDFTSGDGRGGCSIYGTRFKDETFKGKAGKHHAPGLLSMANAGPNTNGSQFFITVEKATWLDGKHVVFGQVTSGWPLVKEIEKLGTPSGAPQSTVTIKNCGVLQDPKVNK